MTRRPTRARAAGLPVSLSAAIALALSATASGQDVTTTPVVAQKQVRAVRVATPPVIDGRMDDAQKVVDAMAKDRRERAVQKAFAETL